MRVTGDHRDMLERIFSHPTGAKYRVVARSVP